MLVLSRHRDERICIGNDVVITVVDIRGDKVRLGIDAPKGVPVHRREVYEAIQRDKQRSKRAACQRCRDEGRIANSEEGEPWSYWENLPPGSDLAVRLNVVRPIPCPACTGK